VNAYDLTPVIMVSHSLLKADVQQRQSIDFSLFNLDTERRNSCCNCCLTCSYHVRVQKIKSKCHYVLIATTLKKYSLSYSPSIVRLR